MLRKDSEDAIKLLREKGVGYVKIGQMLGLGRDDVRNYCVKNGLGGRRSNADIVRQPEESVADRVLRSGNYIEYVKGYECNAGRIVVRCLICGCEREVSYVQAVYRNVRCPQCREFKREYKDYFSALTKKTKALEKENARKESKKGEYTQTCKVCGKVFTSGRIKNTCSDGCRRKYINRTKDKRLSSDIVDNKDITLESLYKRDKGVCHICGKPCNYEDYTVAEGVFIAGNWYPSIDHVVPVSKGGRHNWDNVRLAHRLCNSIKKDKL